MAQETTGEPKNMGSDKHSKIEWLPAGHLPDIIMDYQKHTLEQIAAGVAYGEYGWEA